ncbi:MAG: YkgB family protein [Thermomicrobiales bacterium]
MSSEHDLATLSGPGQPTRAADTGSFARRAARPIERAGRTIALIGIVLPLLLIGGLKFTQFEIEGLKPLIGGTPWLAWTYAVFGETWTAYLLGVVEIATALLIASPWSARAGVVGGALAALIFVVTSSMLLALPVWEQSLGGFPALNGGGQFLIKDIALVGIALVVLGESLGRVAGIGREHAS